MTLMASNSFTALHRLYGLTMLPTRLPFPSASSIFLRTRAKLHTGPLCRNAYGATRGSPKASLLPRAFNAAGFAGVSLGAFAFMPKVHCDGPTSREAPQSVPPPPASSVSLYELSFGTITGICAGIFIKKGAKAVAWLLGGIFVLLQYLGSTSVVRVDWGRVASKFENVFYTTDATGTKRAPTISSIWSWLVNFLTADFQPRASFLAGLVLGLRMG